MIDNKSNEHKKQNNNIVDFTILENSFKFFKKNVYKISLLAVAGIGLNIINTSNLNPVKNTTYINKINHDYINLQRKEHKIYKKDILIKESEIISKKIKNMGYSSSLTSESEIYFIIKLSEKTGHELDISWKIIFSQWAAESKYFTSYDAVNKHNLAGLGPHYYFKSLNEFSNAFVKTIKDNFPNAMKTDSIKEYSNGLFSKFKYCVWPEKYANANGYGKLIEGAYKTIFKNKEFVISTKNINRTEINKIKIKNLN